MTPLMSRPSRARPLVRMARLARRKPRNVTWSHYLAAALIVAGVADAATTEIALATGQASEANPIVAALQAAFGQWWIVPKMAVHGLLAGAVVYFPNRVTLYAMTALTAAIFAVAINNLLIYQTILESMRDVAENVAPL